MNEYTLQQSSEGRPGRVATKAILPSGGLATRLLPATKSVPKELLPIVDTPILEHLLEEVGDAGISDALVITVRGKEAINDHFDTDPVLLSHLGPRYEQLLSGTLRLIDRVTVHSVRQGGATGMGLAVYRARQHIGDEPFAVVTGDELLDREAGLLTRMIDVQAAHGGIVLAVSSVPDELVPLSDMVAVGESSSDELLTVTDVVKRPCLEDAPSRLALIGRYVLPPEILPVLGRTSPDHGGEVQLPDAMVELARAGVPIHAVPYSGARYDVATRLGLLTTAIQFAGRRDDLRDDLLAWLTSYVAGQEPSTVD
ncbi:sugar phosphate nucleotidyltransferase [Micromonospora sp. C95]|uniref:UTP--glucose-1-phosphate uridylyltransferase n=1 Tax=Micromonospora sp. C95 TaxID=2824882 RepID=UPI001B35B656|nr:sugar phosphate nucleotidyltransferase [Micromonospora sp. C95]MBQ1026073.1 NTP transferase domain-containing protein [Micromonospora sp. C95]